MKGYKSKNEKAKNEKGKDKIEEEQALKDTAHMRGGFRGRGRNNRGRGRGMSVNKESIQRYQCIKYGHYQSECPNREENANYAECEDDEELLLMATANMEHEDLFLMASADVKDISKNKVWLWFLDSGCSNYMSGVKEWFCHLDETFRVSVKLGNGSTIMAMGKGNVKDFGFPFPNLLP